MNTSNQLPAFAKAQPAPARKGWTWNGINFAIDAVIGIGFFIAYNAHMTGRTAHEWFSLAFGAMLLTHLLVHWRWVVSVTMKFLGKLPAMTRVNYALNALLLADFALIMVSGLGMSHSVLPALGITVGQNRTWHGIHEMAANGAIALVLAHIAVHWKWIVDVIRRRVQPATA